MTQRRGGFGVGGSGRLISRHCLALHPSLLVVGWSGEACFARRVVGASAFAHDAAVARRLDAATARAGNAAHAVICHDALDFALVLRQVS